MVETFSTRIVRFFFPAIFRRLDDKEKLIDVTINQRVAEVLLQQDPFEPLLKKFRGVFSKEFEKPEDHLDARSKVMLLMWGYQQREDPSFKYLLEFIMNKQGNITLKDANPTPERILYGRAQLSGMILFGEEVARLGGLWEDKMAKDKPKEFDENLTIE